MKRCKISLLYFDWEMKPQSPFSWSQIWRLRVASIPRYKKVFYLHTYIFFAQTLDLLGTNIDDWMNSASSLDLLRLSTINVIVCMSCGELLLQFCQSILLFRVSFFMFSWIKQLQNYKLFLFTLKMCSSNLKWSHFTNHTQTFSRLTFFQHFFSKYFRCSKTK